MALDTLTARDGDTLDHLLWRERGLGAPDLGPILALNPGLADRGAILPLGTSVSVPPAAAPAPVVRDIINLWD